MTWLLIMVIASANGQVPVRAETYPSQDLCEKAGKAASANAEKIWLCLPSDLIKKP